MHVRKSELLEWNSILGRPAEHKRKCLHSDKARLHPHRDRAAVTENLSRVNEARHLIDGGYSLPLGQPADIRSAVRLAARGATLDRKYQGCR